MSECGLELGVLGPPGGSGGVLGPFLGLASGVLGPLGDGDLDTLGLADEGVLGPRDLELDNGGVRGPLFPVLWLGGVLGPAGVTEDSEGGVLGPAAGFTLGLVCGGGTLRFGGGTEKFRAAWPEGI